MNGIGTYLASGRERAGMTIEDVAAVTRIPVRSLRALEGDRLDNLPAPAYTRGFVISYCRTVGIDPDPALAALADHWRTQRASGPGRDEDSASTTGPDSVCDIVLDRGREPAINWTVLAIVIVFMVGILVAILTVGTGAGLEDVSRVLDVPKVQHVDPVPHG